MKKYNISKMFGKFVCDDKVLKKYVSKREFNNYLDVKEKGGNLEGKTAKAIAKAIKKWALSMGATHYTHWFMPLNGKTAEKQVSFVEFNPLSGVMIEDLSEKALVKGEADASSFPNGGERMTFEARGYTIWDYTSPVFIKEDFEGNKTLYIPTAFCSYNGIALDEKTPLLRATESLNREALRVLKILGYDDVKKVHFFSGIEQEYFLIRRDDYNSRLDMKMLARTLLGAKVLKSQEISSHYFGAIGNKVSAFMNEVDEILWKMGVAAKHQHNEVAPCQYELVPIYTHTNIACDQNQLIMETLKKMAHKYNFEAIFEEKPFAGVNGSGKHANWSVCTDTNLNLFDVELEDKDLFFTFFVAMIVAIDKYNKLIRISASSRNNDFRLGGDEAPPSIVSMFASDYVLNLFEEHFCNGGSTRKKDYLDFGVKTLPKTVKDFCDRNRTSPFTFGGNRFEFRMIGSSQSVTFPSTCLCVALSRVLKEMADVAEKEVGDKKACLIEIVKKYFYEHKNIIFNGNGYDKSWEEEARKRGIPIFENSLEAFEEFDNDEIIEAFESTKVLSKNEILLRKFVFIKTYCDTVMLEAKTMVEMFNKNIFNSIEECFSFYNARNSWKIRSKVVEDSRDILITLITSLEEYVCKAEREENLDGLKVIIKEKIIPVMKLIRVEYDKLEKIIPEKFQPFANYNKILYK